jgi:putative NIF3 family GTP cyclohydrolase 1 type 2
MKTNHPYEEVAYYIYNLDNVYAEIGSGMLGDLPEKMDEAAFFKKIHQLFQIPVIKHSVFRNKSIQKVAICGGAGSFLLEDAKRAGADIFITGDFKYHQFFDADGSLVIADIGHYESEQFTIELLGDWLSEKFPTFALRLTENNTNPINYL